MNVTRYVVRLHDKRFAGTKWWGGSVPLHLAKLYIRRCDAVSRKNRDRAVSPCSP